jgi:D-sedoheptulose 7-phosphate isomerase
MAGGCDTGCRDDAEMPETGDANLHCRPPTASSITTRERLTVSRFRVMLTPDSYAALYLREVGEIVRSLDPAAVDELANALADVRRRDGRLFILGVGGGAAHASHAVNDFRKLCDFEAYAPTDNVAELTARTNDEGWETSFDAWLRTSRLSSRDAILVFSVGGGNRTHNVSVNLVRAIELAQEVGARIFGVVGRADGTAAEIADVCIIVDAPAERRTPHVEEFQAILWHLLVSHPALSTAPGKWESVEVTKGR